jgi:hypothetical protein
MMDEYHIKEIMDRARMTRRGRPYEYKINRKNRVVVE